MEDLNLARVCRQLMPDSYSRPLTACKEKGPGTIEATVHGTSNKGPTKLQVQLYTFCTVRVLT